MTSLFQTKFVLRSAWLAALFTTSLGVHTATAASFADLPISKDSRWVMTEDPSYAYSKGSSSRYLTPKEAALRHTLSVTVQEDMVNAVTFKVGCMLESSTPLFELNVSGLDIRIFDSINDFVYARFMVDDNQEYSLRGDIMSSKRIMFAPTTRVQDKNLSDLFLQMREGGQLKIGLLQGENAKVREYTIPLNGFMQYSDQILQSCQSYHQYAGNQQMQFLPDYMTTEPEGYAPKDFTLRQDDEKVVDPNAPKPAPVVAEAPKPEPVAEPTPPDVLPFTPDGSPASIGPDGKPIGVHGSAAQTGRVGQSVDQSLGTASGPMQIGPDGMPIMNNNGNANGTNDKGNQSQTQPAPQEPTLFDNIF